MQNFKNIFIILTYKNTADLVECLESIKNKVVHYKVIVVNSYADVESYMRIKQISVKYDCDFLNVENKGYSYGNNMGIQFALNKYQFTNLIISNPDIVIERFCDDLPDGDIIAPKIITSHGKNQNPMIIKQLKLAEYFIYIGLKHNIKLVFFLGLAIKKIFNNICYRFNLRNNKFLKIFAAHGSFVIINKRILDILNPLYDENLFLFGEEVVLAYKCKKNGFQTIYFPDIVVYHKEDGSMKLADFSINSELRKSNIFLYENYIKNSFKDN